MTALRLDLGCCEGGELRVRLALDHHLNVVALAPRRGPGPQPGVVARDEVRPLDDREPARELLLPVAERAGERVGRTGSADRDRRGRHTRAAQER